MRRAHGLALASAATAWLLVVPARAQPVAPPLPPAGADVEDARKHYARGVELYEQHADAAALAELERAYQLAPNWKVLYEVGVVELAVHDFAAALQHFEKYLDEGRDEVPAQRRREVTLRIAELRQEVATITLVAPDGAEIKLDDVPAGTAPLARPLVVNPGHHKLVASRDGLVSDAHVISVAGGDHLSAELVIAAPPAAPAPLPPPLPLPPEPLAPAASPVLAQEVAPPRASSPPLWVGWLATGVLAAGAVVTGAEALGANASLTNAKNGGATTAANLGSLSSRAHAFAAASDVMTGAAVITAGVTLYFALRPSPGAPRPAAGVAVGVGLGTVSIAGAF